MRDIAISLVVFGSLPFILFRPWIGVLMFAWLSLMTPYRFAFGFAYDFPFAAIVAVVTLLGLVVTKDEVRLDANAVVLLLILLPAWTCVTYLFALEPAAAMPRLKEVLKVFVFVLVSAMVLRTRKHLDWMVWVIVLSVGLFGAKGGVFTLLSSGTGRVLGPPGDSFLSDNNAIAVALIMVIPLMYYLRGQSKSMWIRHGLLAAMVLSGIAVLGTYSRGGFVAVCAMLMFLWLKSQRKALSALLLMPLVPLVLTAMPERWFDRMNTIANYEQDGSAMGRINAWKTLINIANDRPIVGGGFELYSDATFAKYAPDPEDLHSAHSIYFQMLGEHGYVGLLIFLSLGLAAWSTARRTIAIARAKPEHAWAGHLARAFQVSLVGYAVAGVFVNISYWNLIYYEIVIVLVAWRLASAPALPVPSGSVNTGVPRVERPRAGSAQQRAL
jgi:probable O-glycosylation ligase (exosortase A-associated)